MTKARAGPKKGKAAGEMGSPAARSRKGKSSHRAPGSVSQNAQGKSRAAKLPQPPIPPDVDLRSFPYMPLEVLRLRDSTLIATAEGDAEKAALMLWCACWHQVPAGSLPSDERELAHLAGLGRDLTTWRKLKVDALRGFAEHSDGRLYHSIIAEKAVDAWQKKQARQRQTQAATEARQRRRNRNDERNDERNGQRDDGTDVDRNVHQQRGRGKGKGSSPSLRSGERARARRWGDEEQVPEHWITWAVEHEGLSQQQAMREAEKFADHWRSQSGQRGVKRDWFATWKNWCRRSRDDFKRSDGGNGANNGEDAEWREKVEKLKRRAKQQGISHQQSEPWSVFEYRIEQAERGNKIDDDHWLSAREALSRRAT